MQIEYPSAFVGGALGGHRLRANGAGPDVAFNELDRCLSFLLDDTWAEEPRRRAGEYLIGFAEGWAFDG